MISEDSLLLLQLYGHYKAGHLYAAGGVALQPALYLEAMRTIDGVLAAVTR